MEPFKNLFNLESISGLSARIKGAWPGFDEAAYLQLVFDSEWEARELKSRMRHAARCLCPYLTVSFSKAVDILIEASKGQKGFVYIILPEYITLAGLDDLENSARALAELTKSSSSEFGVRPFIKRYGQKMLDYMYTWAQSDNVDIRRLASEGCRPILPWGEDLPALRANPEAILGILEVLKADPALYVRKSVANNLNSISKDNPDFVLYLAERWYGKADETNWILKHGLRTLLKARNKRALKLFSYQTDTEFLISDFQLETRGAEVILVQAQFTVSVSQKSAQQNLGKLRLEYDLGMPRKHGKTGHKVFMISDRSYEQDQIRVNFTHSFKPVTTRVYYPGTYTFALLVNGTILAERSIHLDL